MGRTMRMGQLGVWQTVSGGQCQRQVGREWYLEGSYGIVMFWFGGHQAGTACFCSSIHHIQEMLDWLVECWGQG